VFLSSILNVAFDVDVVSAAMCYEVQDLVFLADSSTKTNPDAWSQILNFVNLVIGRFVVGNYYTRVGFVEYADSTQTLFSLNNVYTNAQAIQAVSGAPYLTGNSNSANALNFALQQSFGQRGQGISRDGVPKVLVLITDGSVSSTSDLINAANSVKAAGIKLVVVGINWAAQINIPTLYQIASSNDSTFIVSDYGELQSWVGPVTYYSC
jgi:von Willebrand factor type A domain